MDPNQAQPQQSVEPQVNPTLNQSPMPKQPEMIVGGGQKNNHMMLILLVVLLIILFAGASVYLLMNQSTQNINTVPTAYPTAVSTITPTPEELDPNDVEVNDPTSDIQGVETDVKGL